MKKEEIEIKKCVLFNFIDAEDYLKQGNPSILTLLKDRGKKEDIYLVYSGSDFSAWIVSSENNYEARRMGSIPEEYIKSYVDMESEESESEKDNTDFGKKEGWVSAQTLLKTIELLTKK